MAAVILSIDPVHPQPRHIERAVAVFEAGGLVVYPTDTYYGLGCDLFNKGAIERIYQLKGRDRKKPLSFVCSDLSDVARYAQVSDYGYRAMRRYTPGPFTFVLQATAEVPRMVITKQKTVGIRVPDSPVALALAERLGRPIVSTSASTPDGEALVDPRDIKDYLGHAVDLILDVGLQLNEPSTVLSLVNDDPVVLREGKGDASDLL